MMIDENARSVLLCRMVMLLATFFLLFRLAIHAMPFQFLNPPFFSLALELPYRLFMLLRLPEILVASPIGSMLFTAALIFFACAGILFPRKNVVIIIFSVLYLFYVLSYNTFTLIHSHPLSVMVWLTVPFWARRPSNRLYLWEALRYYVCFIYATSFIYKIVGGSLFQWGAAADSVMWNHAKYLLYFPDTITSAILRFSIANPVILNAGQLLIFGLEGLMIAGFFTKKYDGWLLWIPVIVHLATYLYSDVFFIEFLPAVLLFFNDRKLERISRLWPGSIYRFAPAIRPHELHQ